ncbi:MAG: SDR family oxidoreductase [Chloroflexi bacterium]|nr:SDR family oxidoreductase [Chloroflexota bacterium]
MRIVVTGGAGFVGSHLCDYLLARGHQVICLDNLSTGNRANIKHLLPSRSFELREHDVTDRIGIDGGIDYVLHFASPASPVDFERIPLQILRTGAVGTLNALELAAQKGAGFLLASTSEVYGDALVHPQREDYWGNVNPIGIRSVYDEGKRFAEAATMAYHRQQGLDTKIARIFNTYGPRMRETDGRVIVTLVLQALRNEPLTVFGDGSQTRSFCYVSDLVAGIDLLMLSGLHDPVNLGNPDEMTILELARRILEITGSRSTIVNRPLPENDPKVRRPDIGRAQQLLGWSPQVSLHAGLLKTIDWLKAVDGSQLTAHGS